MGILACLEATRRPLSREVKTLANSFMILEMSDFGGILARVEARSSFLNQIKARQFKDAKLSKICYKILQGKAKK